MKTGDPRVLVEGDVDDTGVATLRAQDLDDVAAVLGGPAIGSDGVGGVIEKEDGVGISRIVR